MVGLAAALGSKLFGATGMSSDSGGFGIGCGDDVANGCVNVGGDGTVGDGSCNGDGLCGVASSDEDCGLSPGGTAGEPSNGSVSSIVVSSVVV